MTRISYKSALRAKGIKPLKLPPIRPRADGDVELLPVRGALVHTVSPPNNVVRLKAKA